MRAGLMMSAGGHVAIVAAAIFVLATPKSLQVPLTRPISVDIVTPNEIGLTSKAEATKAEGNKSQGKDAKAVAAETKSSVDKREVATKPVEATSKPREEAAKAPTPVTSDPAGGPAPTATPAGAASMAIQRGQATLSAKPVTSPLLLPTLAPSGASETIRFDAPAIKSAGLSEADVKAFRAHLQSCWTVPSEAAQAPRLRIVLRVALAPGGTIAAEPLLIEGTASELGPALMAEAKRALRQCQPYPLPADKYEDWKLLDLAFTPSGLS
jgi:hypothetical protein